MTFIYEHVQIRPRWLLRTIASRTSQGQSLISRNTCRQGSIRDMSHCPVETTLLRGMNKIADRKCISVRNALVSFIKTDHFLRKDLLPWELILSWKSRLISGEFGALERKMCLPIQNIGTSYQVYKFSVRDQIIQFMQRSWKRP